MLQHISTLTQLTFTQFFNDNEGAAQLRYAMTDATGAAHAYLPGNSDEAGSAWFNKTDFNAPAKGNYAWMGILHETGHALGLKHGHEFPVAISGRPRFGRIFGDDLPLLPRPGPLRWRRLHQRGLGAIRRL